jgi:cellulase/cellobiase CelA1
MTPPPTTTPPPPTTTPPPPTTTPPPTFSPPPTGECAASYQVTGSWQGGFQAEVTIRNTGTTAMTGWAVTWSFPNGQRIAQLWNGSHTQSGANVTVRNVSWNGALAPNATATFGFLGSWTGTNAAPTPLCTRG